MASDLPPRSALREQPTAFAWEVQLRRLLEGYEALTVIRLGGIQEYIEVALADSSDKPLSETCFHEALRNVVQAWQPEAPVSLAQQERVLRLISAYTPSNGAVKIVGFLRKWGEFPERLQAETEYGDSIDLTMLALLALEGYFSVPPQQHDHDSGLFSAYAEMLREFSAHKTYAGYALRRLLELDLIRPESLEIANTLDSFEQTLVELVSFFINREQSPATPAHLSALYQQCLRAGLEATDAFSNALTSTGSRLVFGTTHPVVLTPSSTRIDLSVPLALAETYFLSSMNNQVDAREFLAALDEYDEEMPMAALDQLLV